MIKNNWFGVGRITNDLELKVTQSGKKVLNFDIAIDDGTRERPHTTFLPMEAWERTAEIISSYFHKGDQIILSGHLGVKKYVDRGENRYRLSVVIESFEWGAKKREENKEDFAPRQTYTPNDVSGFDYPWEQ